MSGVDLKSRYVAAMVLSGVGDALGYRRGDWEFCHSGEMIHREAEDLGGVEQIKVSLPGWPVSDDTVLHLATAEALATEKPGEDREQLYARLAEYYKMGMKDMAGRAPGPTTMSACHQLRPNVKKGYTVPFNSRGGGCGAAMRAMCIGLRYPRSEELDDLIAVSVESGRMTHHHPTGFLGSLAAALFTAYSIQDRPLKSWGIGLVKEVLPKALEYIRQRGECVEENEDNWGYFKSQWEKYLKTRGLTDGKSDPQFPDAYGVKARDVFYRSLSYSGWGGSSGHDAPMIAYDALLNSHGDWKQLCSKSMFHSGDSDSTGVIAACCYGAMFGFQGVPECNYRMLEYRKRMEKAAVQLYSLSHPEACDIKTQESLAKNIDEAAQDLPKVPSNDDLLKHMEDVAEPSTTDTEKAKASSDDHTGDAAEPTTTDTEKTKASNDDHTGDAAEPSTTDTEKAKASDDDHTGDAAEPPTTDAKKAKHSDEVPLNTLKDQDQDQGW